MPAISKPIEEIQFGPGACEIDSTLRDAWVRECFGMTVLAIRKSDDTSWTYNR